MDAVTYPDPRVQELLAEHFVGLSIDLLARHPDLKEASLGQKVMFAPTFVFADAKHRELRRFTGWLPPKSFAAELELVRATAAMQKGDLETAARLYRLVAGDYADTEAAPEALYWAGVAGFLHGKKDWAALKAAWGELASRYAGNRFATHASVIEDAE
jgi:hypothetical protein